MNAPEQAGEEHDLHEGSWVYLSLGEVQDQEVRDLRDSLTAACHASGWAAISWSRPTRPEHDPDHARFFEGVSDAVAQADLLVTLLTEDSSTIGDAELAFAYRYRRPVVGIKIADGGEGTSEVRALLPGYGRARIVECEGIGDCAAALRSALSDSDFLATIYEASMEQALHA
jgi:hypothetical protein